MVFSMGKIVYYFYKIYGVLLGLISRFLLMFISPKSNRVLISCSEGRYFNSNSKQLFDVMYSQQKDVYFITRDFDLLKLLQSKYGNKIVFSYSFKALKIYVQSKVIVISHGLYDTTPFNPYSNNKITINVWHGFPFKAIGASMENLNPNEISSFLKLNSNLNYMISSSDFETNILSTSFGLLHQQIIKTGYPRYDLLLNKDESVLDNLDIKKGSKILLYAPTYRDDTDLILFPFKDYSFKKLNEFLTKENIILLVRLHKNDRHKIEGKIEFNENIIYLDQKKLEDVNEILPLVDLLITDYSGIIIDYAVLRKPMIFIPYDIEEYTKHRGMNVDLLEMYPGNIVKTFNDFTSNVTKSLGSNNSENIKLNKFIEQFHQYKIGSATNNVIKFIDSL